MLKSLMTCFTSPRARGARSSEGGVIDVARIATRPVTVRGASQGVKRVPALAVYPLSCQGKMEIQAPDGGAPSRQPRSGAAGAGGTHTRPMGRHSRGGERRPRRDFLLRRLSSPRGRTRSARSPSGLRYCPCRAPTRAPPSRSGSRSKTGSWLRAVDPRPGSRWSSRRPRPRRAP